VHVTKLMHGTNTLDLNVLKMGQGF